MLSRNERINQKKKEQLTNFFITTNKRLKRSVAVLSTSLFMTTVVKPVEMVLAAEKTALGTKDTQVYSTNPFLNQIIPSATIIAAKNDLYASVMMAQAILESGWGTSALASTPNYNLFGIKGNYDGESVNMGTLEDSGGQNYYPINAEFRKYPSYAESLQDYANLLANGTSWNPNYYAGAWKSNAASYQDATAYLTGRYATDTAYSAKLNRIIAQYGLDQYDNYQLVDDEEVENPDAGNVDFETPTDSPDLPNVDLPENSDEDTGEQEKPSEPEEDSEEVDTPDAPVQAGEAFHVVQPGDTLYAIAKKYGISLVDLLTLNKLTSNMIYVGDRLVLPDSVIVEGNNPDEDTDAEKAPTTPTSEYTVVGGDTLYKIAAANGLTIGELKSLNALTSDTIFVGQKLLLVKTTTTAPDKTENESNNNADQTTTQSYTVKSGDTLWSIANATNMTVAALKAANSLTSDAIYPGQVLKTIGTSAPTTGTNTGTTITGAFIKPASGYISSPFGYRTSPINGALEFHRGIDLAGSGNISSCSFYLTVKDYTPPVAVCDEYTIVAIGPDDPEDCYDPNNGCDFGGVTWVKAITFDDGSYDNCGFVKFSVRRAAPYSDCIQDLNKVNGGQPCDDGFPYPISEYDRATAEGDSVKFYCCEVGTSQMVILRVYQLDALGNISIGPDGTPIYNECQVEIEVQDKLKPGCQSPANVTVSCENFDPSLWAYGIPTVQDNCCLDSTKILMGQKGLTQSVSYTQFDTVCNKGTITRTFRVYDCHGFSSQCTQRIVVTYDQEYFVKVPNDKLITFWGSSCGYGAR